MRVLRVIWRLCASAVWFVLVALAALPGMFAGRRGIRWNGRLSQLWGRGLVRLLNIRILGRGNVPDDVPGALIVSNHQSYLDILVESALFPVRFLPKAEIRFWPVLGWFLALNRPIWVNRKSPMAAAKVAREIERSLQENIPVLAYPEGTTSDGQSLLPFKSTAFEPVVRARLAVLPVLLRYTPAADGYPIGWYGDMTLLPHAFHTLGQPGFEVRFEQLPPVVPLPGEDRKTFANRVRQIMLEHYSERM